MEIKVLIENIILVVGSLVGAIAIGLLSYFGLKEFNISCRLGYHRPVLSEMSYNFETREISVHCLVCQKVVYEVKSEDHLTDEQWMWFKKIFEGVV
ncbi:hypothetical protein LCGC14_2570880 [marine sediment metagenome]|uniref:Uncharacterized protein n=1 Tax=marine sediment metagenome TaxID=412755 RepID=A0A0F9CTE6_9ZZZZ